MKHKFEILKYLVVVILSGISITALAVWAPPVQSPTGGNTPSPINTGTATQQKSGGIVVGGIRSFSSAIIDTNAIIGANNTPNSSSVLELFSTSKGFLTPRMTTAQRDAINSPATGLLIYNTTTGAHEYYNGVSWVGVADGASNGANPWNKSSSKVFLSTLTDEVGIGLNNPVEQFQITENFRIPNTASSGSVGVILKPNLSGTSTRFIHNYDGAGTLNNTFVGLNSGNFTTTGNGRNSGFGYNTLNAISSGVDNTAVGWESLRLNTTGSSNTAVGRSALDANTSGGANTALGLSALFQNTTGGNNTGVGSGALYRITTGTNNTALGTSADVSSGGGALTNATAIGYSANVSTSNTMVFGNGSVTKWGFGVSPSSANIFEFPSSLTTARLTTSGAWTNASDKSLKHDITSINYGLDTVMKLNPVSFKWNNTNKSDIGFVAQEIKEVLPEIVYGEEGEYSVAYGNLSAVLVKAVQELKAKNDALEIKIKELESKN